MNRGATILMGLALGGVLTGCSNGQDAAGPAAGSSWPAPDKVAERVSLAGLDLGPMGMAEHYHPHLRVIIDGEDVTVAPNIGVDTATGRMSAVHTHEDDGTVHIEATTVGERFTLGQLFTQWGVNLSPTEIGGIKAAAGEGVVVTANGVEVGGDPNDIRLEPDQEIVVRLGSTASK